MAHKRRKSKKTWIMTTHLRPNVECDIYKENGKVVAYKGGGSRPVWEWKSMKDFNLTKNMLIIV